MYTRRFWQCEGDSGDQLRVLDDRLHAALFKVSRAKVGASARAVNLEVTWQLDGTWSKMQDTKRYVGTVYVFAWTARPMAPPEVHALQDHIMLWFAPPPAHSVSTSPPATSLTSFSEPSVQDL